MKKITPKEFTELLDTSKTELFNVFQDKKYVEEVVGTYVMMKRQDLLYDNILNLVHNEHGRTRKHVREGVSQYQIKVLNKLEELENLIKGTEEE